MKRKIYGKKVLAAALSIMLTAQTYGVYAEDVTMDYGDTEYYEDESVPDVEFDSDENENQQTEGETLIEERTEDSDAEEFSASAASGDEGNDSENFLDAGGAELQNSDYGSVIASGSCGASEDDDLTWNVYESSDQKSCTVVISGIGKMKDYSSKNAAPWQEYADSQSAYEQAFLILENGITSIGTRAFSKCEKFTGGLSIPDSVTTIGKGAFFECRGFNGKLKLPSKITTIQEDTFWECKGFTGELKIPEGVTKIEDGAFYMCSSFTGELKLPSEMTMINYNSFAWCSGFTGELKIPDSVTLIENDAFYNCSGFTGNLNIPSNVKKIEDGAFAGCEGFNGELNLPDGITEIAGNVFNGCKGFAGELKIPDSVTKIGDSAFLTCEGFTGELKIPDKVKTIGIFAFSGCKGLTGELKFPEGVTEIGSRAFEDCNGLTGVIVPDTTTTIGNYAFEDCGGLEKILIYNPECYMGDECLNGTDAIIYGYADSTAQKYAEKYKHEFRLLSGETVEPVDYVSDLTYLAMSDAAYLNKLTDYVGKGTLGADAGKLRDKKIVNTALTEEENLTWGMLYDQCLSTWEVAETYDSNTSGLWVAVFKRENQVVVAFRGSEDITNAGTDDWLEDDAVMALFNRTTPQMNEALSFVKAVQNNPKYSGCDISLTGHSLGGGLAIYAANGTNLKAVPWDSAPTVDVGYYCRWDELGGMFKGIDKWTYTEHMNESCYVGGLEASLKTVVKHENLSPNIKDRHDRYSIVTYNYEQHKFELSKITNSRKWNAGDKIEQGISHGVLSNVLDILGLSHMSQGILILGSSASEKLAGVPLLPNTEVIYGGDGADSLYGFQGDDYLIGGNGNDRLDGNTGNDTYIYFKGQGVDTIYDYQGNDTVKLYGFSSGDRISVVNTVNFTYIQCNGEDIIKISKNRSMLKTNSFVLEIMDGTSVLQQEKLMDWNIWKSVRTYKIACPVSVQVYDDTTGEMVGEVKDGAEYNENTEYGNLYSIYNEETGEYDKMLDLTEGYSVKIVGENSGTMDVSITETAENGKESTYSVNEVPVSRDEVFTVEADQKELVSSDTSKEVIKLEDENGEKVCEHRDTFWKTTMNSACTKTGAKEKICNSCGAVLETQIIPMTAHTWGAESIIKQATVLEKGSRQKICKVCGATENTDIPKLSPSMTLTVSSLPLQVKKSVNAGSFVTGLANGDYVKSYVSGNKKIAVVSGKGKVTAKKAGTVKIVITLASGLKKNLTVKVQKSAVKTKKISGLKKNLALRVREKIKLSPIVSPVTSSQKISYSSSNKKIVTVSSKGVCTAKKVGKARITVKSGAKKYVVNVIVKK